MYIHQKHDGKAGRFRVKIRINLKPRPGAIHKIIKDDLWASTQHHAVYVSGKTNKQTLNKKLKIMKNDIDYEMITAEIKTVEDLNHHGTRDSMNDLLKRNLNFRKAIYHPPWRTRP